MDGQNDISFKKLSLDFISALKMHILRITHYFSILPLKNMFIILTSCSRGTFCSIWEICAIAMSTSLFIIFT